VAGRAKVCAPQVAPALRRAARSVDRESDKK